MTEQQTGWRRVMRAPEFQTRHRALSAAIVVLLIAGVSALGTTNDPDRQGPVGVGEPEGEDTGSEAGVAAVVGQEGATGVTEQDGRSGPAGAVPGGSATNRGGGPQATAVSGASAGCGFVGCERAQGVTDTEIKLGFMYYENTDQLFASLGAEGFASGDARRMVRALLDDVNRRGGVAGRKLVPVFAGINATSADGEGQFRQACVSLTEDHKVFAGFLGEPNTAACFAAHKTLLLNSATADTGDDPFFQQYAPWAQWPTNKSHSRVIRTLLPLLDSQRFFRRDAAGREVASPKVGLLVWDKPRYVSVADRQVKPYLKAAGLPFEESRIVPFGPDHQAQVQQTVLRFKSEGVTHVMFVPGLGSMMFMNAAERQEFRPRYALDSTQVPNAVTTLAPHVQLKGMLGIGWVPQVDVTDDGYPYTAQERRCMDLLKKAGENVQSRNQPYFGLHFCDLVWTFEAAANRAGRDLTSGSLVTGLRGLGRKYPSLLTFGSDLGAGTPDGAYHHRLLAWQEGGCGKAAPSGCFRYSGGALRDVER